MKKRILLFARDPGGANTIIPLYVPLVEKGFSVKLFGKDTALKKYSDFSLPAINISDIVKKTGYLPVRSFLAREKPDFIITGTSANDFTEKYIWKAAWELGIPSFAILDQWMNYGIRFSKYGLSDLRKYEKSKKHPYLPTKIIVMDEYASTQMAKEGIKKSRLLICGQPYFEELANKKFSKEKIDNLRKSFGFSESDFIITYASEAISKTFNETDDSDHYLGYTERTIFRDLLQALEAVSKHAKKRIVLIVKLHPQETRDNYANLTNSKEGKVVVLIDEDSSPWDLINISQLICGMSSMLLLEAVILKKPVLSVQTGLCRENPFILDKRGILKSILDEETLLHKLKEIIIENRQMKCTFNVEKHPVANIISNMEPYLCLN